MDSINTNFTFFPEMCTDSNCTGQRKELETAPTCSTLGKPSEKRGKVGWHHDRAALSSIPSTVLRGLRSSLLFGILLGTQADLGVYPMDKLKHLTS